MLMLQQPCSPHLNFQVHHPSSAEIILLNINHDEKSRQTHLWKQQQNPSGLRFGPSNRWKSCVSTSLCRLYVESFAAWAREVQRIGFKPRNIKQGSCSISHLAAFNSKCFKERVYGPELFWWHEILWKHYTWHPSFHQELWGFCKAAEAYPVAKNWLLCQCFWWSGSWFLLQAMRR